MKFRDTIFMMEAMALILTGCAGGAPEETTLEEALKAGEQEVLTVEEPELKPFYLRLDKNPNLSAEDVFIALRGMLPEAQYETYRTEAYGGLYYDDRGNLVLCVTEGNEELLALPAEEETPYVIESVKYSYFQLRQVVELVNGLMDQEGPEGLRSCGLRLAENKVVLGVVDESIMGEMTALLPETVEADILEFELLGADDVFRSL